MTELNTKVKMPGNIWMKAAVAGGLWAAFEIIIGSFLHNLRIPFAGSILSATAVILVIAFHRLWPVRGIVWRAGLICALMKTISPSALIIGPMIGIFSEALLIEISLRLFGKNRIAYLIGGMLGVSSSLIHKIVSIWILYGNDIIQVYLNIYKFSVKQLGIENITPGIAISALFAIYLISGGIAAIIGMSVPIENQLDDIEVKSVDIGLSTPFELSGVQFSIKLLLAHLAAVPAFILMLRYLPMWVTTLLMLAWAFGLYFKYPQVIRRFRKPVLWVQFLLIVLFAAFFMDSHCKSLICFSLAGFYAGLAMMMRAALLILAFAAISVEVRNPVVRLFLERRGMRNLYYSLSIAFAALPFMIEQIPPARTLLRNPRSSMALALANAAHWLNHLEQQAPAGVAPSQQ